MKRRIAIAALGCACLAGTFWPDGDSLPPQHLGGYQVLHGDFHVHGFLGDGVISPWMQVRLGYRQGLHVVAITNHNQVLSGKMAASINGLTGGRPLVLVGEEITMPSCHVIGVGLSETVSWRQTPESAIAAIHRQGGVAIAAHPTASHRKGFKSVARLTLDGTELAHPLVHEASRGGEHLRAFWREIREERPRFTAIGSSDDHGFGSIGLCRTLIFAADFSKEAVLAAIRAGRTVVFDTSGTAHGDADMIALLTASAVSPLTYLNRDPPPWVRGVTALGWLAMPVLLLFGWWGRENRPGSRYPARREAGRGNGLAFINKERF